MPIRDNAYILSKDQKLIQEVIEIKQLVLPSRYVAASGSMGPTGEGWHTLQKLLFYQHLTPTTKTVTLLPRRGNCLIKAYRPLWGKQSCVNAMSLGNRGVDHLATSIIPHLPKPSIVSFHASDAEECQKICNILSASLRNNSLVLAIEINLSCPNVTGIEPRNMIDTLEVASSLPWPIIAKIGHEDRFIEMALTAVRHSLIEGIAAINSVHWSHIFPPEVKSPLRASCGQMGGVSGKLIQGLALQTISTLREGLKEQGSPRFPVIGGGGISNLQDIDRFEAAGASHFSFGSSLNMPDLWPQICRALR